MLSGNLAVRFVGPVDGRTDVFASALASDPGFTVTYTTDPAAATDALDTADCVVCPAALPDGDGRDVLRAIREYSPSFPVVMVADTRRTALASDAISLGVTEYVRVDHAETDLATRVENAVSKYRTERHRRNDGIPPADTRQQDSADASGDDSGVRTADGGLVGGPRERTDRTQRAQAVRERERALRRLYEVTADTTLDFEEKLDSLLELGRERFDVDLGGFARIDPASDTFRVETVAGDHEHLKPGAKLALSETYCRLLPAADDVVTVSEPASAGFADAACYDEFGIESYLGTKIEVNGELYGSFFFVSTDRRDGFSETEKTFHHLMGEWMRSALEREHHEDRLAALTAVTQDLMGAESRDALRDRVTEAAESRLSLPFTALAVLDDAGTLAVTARTDAMQGEPVAALCADNGVGWRALADDETAVAEAPAAASFDRAIAVPLGGGDVLVVGTDAGVQAETEFVEAFASSVEAVIDRLDHERLLHDREETLAEQNESLERLNQVNDLIRGIDKGLVSASSRGEIEDVVCDHLGNRGPYELAWVGSVEDDEIVPQTRAGNEKGYLDEVDVPLGDESTAGPAARAVQTRETQVVDDFLTHTDFGPWRQAALNRGYRSGIVLPLDYEGSLYGVLCVYAGQPGAFSELERSVLDDLSETIAYAINATETKRGLVDEQVTELAFELGADAQVTRFARRLDVEFTVENVVPDPDGNYRAFVTVSGASPGTVESHTPYPVLDATHVTAVDSADEVHVFEMTLTDAGIHGRALDHGGVVQELTASPSGATVRVWYPASRDVREFVETFTSRFPTAELTARRQTEHSTMTPLTFRSAVADDLTDRQLEALQTAYFSGFFESPRQRTGTEVADSLDISQPTFNDHLRTAHRKVLSLLFDESWAPPT